MVTYKSFIPILLLCLFTGVFATVSAQSHEPAVSLDQAVLKVQSETGGRVLSAESHWVDRQLKYFIKVLKPDGHVEKLVVSSEASKNPAVRQSTKNPPERRAGSKEKH